MNKTAPLQPVRGVSHLAKRSTLTFVTRYGPYSDTYRAVGREPFLYDTSISAMTCMSISGIPKPYRPYLYNRPHGRTQWRWGFTRSDLHRYSHAVSTTLFSAAGICAPTVTSEVIRLLRASTLVLRPTSVSLSSGCSVPTLNARALSLVLVFWFLTSSHIRVWPPPLPPPQLPPLTRRQVGGLCLGEHVGFHYRGCWVTLWRRSVPSGLQSW